MASHATMARSDSILRRSQLSPRVLALINKLFTAKGDISKAYIEEPAVRLLEEMTEQEAIAAINEFVQRFKVAKHKIKKSKPGYFRGVCMKYWKQNRERKKEALLKQASLLLLSSATNELTTNNDNSYHYNRSNDSNKTNNYNHNHNSNHHHHHQNQNQNQNQNHNTVNAIVMQAMDSLLTPALNVPKYPVMYDDSVQRRLSQLTVEHAIEAIHEFCNAVICRHTKIRNVNAYFINIIQRHIDQTINEQISMSLNATGTRQNGTRITKLDTTTTETTTRTTTTATPATTVDNEYLWQPLSSSSLPSSTSAYLGMGSLYRSTSTASNTTSSSSGSSSTTTSTSSPLHSDGTYSACNPMPLVHAPTSPTSTSSTADNTPTPPRTPPNNDAASSAAMSVGNSFTVPQLPLLNPMPAFSPFQYLSSVPTMQANNPMAMPCLPSMPNTMYFPTMMPLSSVSSGNSLSPSHSQENSVPTSENSRASTPPTDNDEQSPRGQQQQQQQQQFAVQFGAAPSFNIMTPMTDPKIMEIQHRFHEIQQQIQGVMASMPVPTQ